MTTPILTRWLGKLSSGLLLAGLLLSARPGQAQVDTYAFAASSGTYTPLPATATPVPTIQTDDAISAGLPIGFSFVFDGTPYTTFYASSNGFISFNSSAGSANFNDMTAGAASQRPLVAPLWDDLGGGNAASVASYQLTGTAPNRVLTFEWRNWLWRYTATAPGISFQAKLYEGTNRVEFVYRPEAGALTLPTASVGLVGTGTGSGSFLSVSDLTAAPTVSSTTESAAISALPVAGQTYAFTPPAPSLCPTPRNLSVTATTATSATISYTVSNATPGPFTILYGPTGFNPAQLPSSTNVYSTITTTSTTPTLNGLTAQTGYQFYIVQNCGGTNGNSSISNAGSFTTRPNAPANDECTSALPLAIATSCTTPLSGTVFGATQSLAPTTNCGGTTAYDVWYSFTASASALQLTTGAAFSGYYDVRSGACASTTSVSCGTLGSTTSTSQVLVSGLTSGQTYFLRVYSTSIQATATASAFTLCLTPVINYCNTGLGGVCGGNNVTAVSIAGTTLNATGLTCTSANGQSYTAYPATGANTATLQSGVPYQLSVTLDATSIASVWIDYNHNLAFEASEWTQLTTSAASTPTVVTINIPTSAVQGPTGMRIRSRANGNSNGANDACTSFGSGETKDFTITIGPPAACPTASNVVVGTITSTTASLSFTSSASALSYALTLTPQNGTPTTRTVTASPVSLTALLPNTTYTISLVSNCTGSTTSPAVVLTFTTLPVPAPNDECTTAVGLTVAATCTTPVTGTVFGATQSLAPTTNCGGTTANDVWYSFVATSTSHTITLNPQFDAAYDVRSGACASTTSIYCNTAFSGTATNRTIVGLTLGQTYFIRIYASGTQPTGATSSFTLCVVPGPATPVNDDCAGALTAPIQFGTCVGQTTTDNTAATTSAGVPALTGCFTFGTVTQDVWFKVTVPASGSVTVQTQAPTAGSNITDTVMSMYSGTCSTLTEIGCNDDTNGLYSQVTLTGRTPGEVLYIRVWPYNPGTSGLVAVCATSPSNCAVPTGPSVGTITNTTAVLNWVAPTGSTGNTFEIEYGLQNFVQGAGTTITSTATTATITGLTPASTYCFYVRQNCGTANGSSAWVGPTCFTTPLTAPANDEPCGAIGLGAGTRTGTNLGALTSVQPGIQLPVCSSATQPKDVWYSFVASATTASFAMTGAPAGMVRVYSAPSCSAGPFALISCTASGANNTAITAPVTATGLTVGTRYYIAVSGYGSSDTGGQFTITPSAGVLAARAQADTEALLVYPNPSNTGQLTLKLATGNGAGQASLLNALGQVVLTKGLSGATEQTLDTHHLATGLYTLRVETNGQVLTRKVVLE